MRLSKQLIWVVLSFALIGCAGTTTYLNDGAAPTTAVRLMRGAGPSGWSYGVDQIAEMAAKLPGVGLVQVYDYTSAPSLAAAVNNDPSNFKEVVGGFSCGANFSPWVSQSIGRPIALMEVIQASQLCGNWTIPKQVARAQETYNPLCSETGFFGCLLLQPGPGFNPSNFTVIQRYDCHLCADTDPNAQNDMVDGIKAVASASANKRMGAMLGAREPGRVNVIVRHDGQRMY